MKRMICPAPPRPPSARPSGDPRTRRGTSRRRPARPGRARRAACSSSDSGTSPRTMRCAMPSTIAVLPTPGSPMSTGLFFVRRESTCITRRISSSRPMTGSILPLRAASVRSRMYFSSAWNFPSGSRSVTRCAPRTLRERREELVVGDAARRLEARLHLAIVLRAARAGSARPRRSRPSAPSPRPRRAGATSSVRRESAGSAPPLDLRELVEIRLERGARARRDRRRPSGRAGSAMPPSCSSIARMRCSGTSSGLPRGSRDPRASRKASWLFVVIRSGRIAQLDSLSCSCELDRELGQRITPTAHALRRANLLAPTRMRRRAITDASVRRSSRAISRPDARLDRRTPADEPSARCSSARF